MCGYAMTDDCVGGCGGCGAGCPARGGLGGVFDTRLEIVLDGEAFGITKARCLVSSLDRRPLSWRRS